MQNIYHKARQSEDILLLDLRKVVLVVDFNFEAEIFAHGEPVEKILNQFGRVLNWKQLHIFQIILQSVLGEIFHQKYIHVGDDVPN